MFNPSDLKIRRKSWIKTAGIPVTRLGWTLDDCSKADEKHIKMMRHWLSAVESGHVIRSTGQEGCGKGLMLWGTPGHGKTTLALSIIQEAITTFSLEAFDVQENRTLIRPCYFITYSALLDLKGEMFKDASEDQELIYQGIMGECSNDAYNIRILVLDDVGREHASLSGWQKNTLHHVLRTRFNNGLPTIVTTNIKREDWASLYGDSTESFIHEMFTYMPITAPQGDLRK